MEPVVLVGSATIDEQVLEGSDPRVQLGGVVTYGGAAFVAGGVRALAVCNLGGRYSAAAVRVLETLGIALCPGTTEVMTSFRNRVLPDGSREQRILAIGRPIDEELIARALSGLPKPHVHLGPLHGEDISPTALKAIVAAAGTTTLDVQGLLRPARTGDVRCEVTGLLRDALAASRFVKADESELQTVLQVAGPTTDGLLHRFDIDEIVVTRGGEGGYVLSRRRKVDFPAIPATRMYDTTGAGDVFFAAYLVARLHDGQETAAACCRAAAVAARHVAGELLQPGVLSLTAPTEAVP
jgi:sugar/nucleoside kinase (ribokinase family)